MIIRSNPTGGNFFAAAAAKSFDADIAISGNFVLIVKNSNHVVIMRAFKLNLVKASISILD